MPRVDSDENLKLIAKTDGKMAVLDANIHADKNRLAGTNTVVPLYRLTLSPGVSKPQLSGGPAVTTSAHVSDSRSGASHERHDKRPRRISAMTVNCLRNSECLGAGRRTY